jgi:hypothetical protein
MKQLKEELKNIALGAKAKYSNDKPLIRMIINDYLDYICSEPIKGIRKFKKLAIQHLDGLNWCSEVTNEHYEAINKLNKDIRWRQ